MALRFQWVEELGRTLFLGALVRAFGGKRVMQLPDWRARSYRVLFIRNDGIGDLIVSMEAMRAIARPNAWAGFGIPNAE